VRRTVRCDGRRYGGAGCIGFFSMSFDAIGHVYVVQIGDHVMTSRVSHPVRP
jgi:hypothetical protein